MDRYQTEQVINSQLDPGEGLLWSGTPSPGRLAFQALAVTLFGIPFAGFAVFWTYNAFTMTWKSPAPGAWFLFPFFGVPFLLIGLGMLTAPVWAYLGAGRMSYAVTNRRALIVSRFFSTIVQSITYAEMGELQRVERSGGSGDLYFANREVVTRRGTTVLKRVGFLGIPDVRGVEQLIRGRIQQAA